METARAQDNKVQVQVHTRVAKKRNDKFFFQRTIQLLFTYMTVP